LRLRDEIEKRKIGKTRLKRLRRQDWEGKIEKIEKARLIRTPLFRI